jgi:hypothetical protein
MSFGSGADAGTAMSTHVEERPHRATPVTSNDDAFIRDFAQIIVSRRWYLVGAPGANPSLAVEAFELVTEEIGVGVITGR